jgi:hypothetical protein
LVGAVEHVEYPNGDVYDGGYVEGKQHGIGKATYANGYVYQGGWLQGKQHGQGKLTKTNGNVYEGEWVDGKPHGHGKLTKANGDVYEGEWRNGVPADAPAAGSTPALPTPVAPKPAAQPNPAAAAQPPAAVAPAAAAAAPPSAPAAAARPASAPSAAPAAQPSASVAPERPSSHERSTQDATVASSFATNRTQTYTPPASLHSLASEASRFAREVAVARSVPGHHDGLDTRSWQRKSVGVPSWVLPFTPSSTMALRGLKVSFWRRTPYERELRVSHNEHGAYEFATANPATGKVTNSWWAGDVIAVITHGSFVVLSLPGSWLKARTYMHVSMPSEEAAAALVASWGWEFAAEH